MKVCSVCQGRHDDSVACEAEFTSQSLESRENEPEVPGFRLDYQLSSAHHAETYRARDVASGRSCLIKVIAADESSAQQALREAKIAAGLFHPSIANYYDCGRLEDGRCFFVFEDVDGRSLREILDGGGQADLLDTVDIIRQAAEALHTLHRSGLIHGAVHPRNIILSMFASGQAIVRVTDPDLGRLAQRSIISNRFLIDNELDSLRYFSPEQCNGEDATVQTDVYSLGIVFYEMLAGVPPFEASTAVGLIQQHMNQLPPDLRIENFNLRMLVTHALTEALQKQARLRQPSINTLARQLRHIEQLATHSSTPPPAGAAVAAAAMPETAMPKVSSPVMLSEKIDSHQQASEWAPEIITEARTSEIIRNEAITAGAPVTDERPRMVSAEEALEESYATLSNLVIPPPQRPSILQACKTKLQAMTSTVREESTVITPVDEPPPKVSSPATPSAEIDSYQHASEWSPEIITEPKADESIRGEGITSDTPVTAGRPRMVNAEEALEESYATLSNLVTPPPQRPSILQACKTTLHAMTSLLSFEKAGHHESVAVDETAESLDAIETGPRVPKKIEWVQPEDDIPTLDDIKQVLALDMSPAPVVEPVVVERYAAAYQSEIEPTPRVAKKIEWILPEDDLPSIEDVQEVLAMEQEMVPPVTAAETEIEPIKVSAPEPEAAELWQREPQIIQVEAREPEPEVIHVESAIEPQEIVVESPQPEPEVIHVESAVETQEIIVESPQPEPEVIHVESAVEPQEIIVESPQPEPEVIHVASAVEAQEIIVESPQPAPEVIHVESEVEPQEIVVETPQPEPEVIHVESETEPQEIIVESSQPEPEAIHVESAIEPQEIVVESPQPEPEVIHVEAADSEPVEIVVAPPAKKRTKSSKRKSPKVVIEPVAVELEAIHPEPVSFDAQELVVEPQQPEPEVIQAASEPQEIVVEPQQPEPEVIQAASERQEIVVEPQQPEPEVIQAASEPQEIVVEPQQREPEVIQAVPETQEIVVESQEAEPVVSEGEPEPSAPEIVAVPARSPKIVPARLERAVAAVRKRHKKSSHKQPVELVVAPPQIEVVHAESVTHEQEVQELVVEPSRPEPEVIHAESAVSEAPEIIVEATPSEPVPVVIEVAPPKRPEAPKGVVALKQFALDAVQKRQKKSHKQPAELLDERPEPESQVIHVEPAVSEAEELFFEPQQSGPQVIHVEPAVCEAQEMVVEPQVESTASEPEELIFKLQRPAPQPIRIKPAVSEPQEIVVEPQQPEPEVIHAEPATPAQPAFPTVLRRHKKSSRRQPVVIATPVKADDEEITVVRARSKRVRIHVSPPAPQKKSRPTIQRRSPAPVEIGFVPTLLGGGIDPDFSIPEQSDGMFAAYSSESSGPMFRHRSHLIGGGIIALLALVLFGNDVLTGYLHSWSSADSMTAEASLPEQPKPLRSSVTTPVVSKPVISDKPVAADKKDRTTTKTKDRVSSDTTTSIPHESLKKMMILLPTKATQVEAMSQSDSPAPKRKASGTTAQPEPTVTRPRIVKDSQP